MEGKLRPCREDERDQILRIINDGAERYRGRIPDDCWHEPYMSAEALQREIDAGVTFSGLEDGERLIGVMGIQCVRDVELIRHAYVATAAQGGGVGSALIQSLKAQSDRPLLVGTWAAATWAISFYERHGFVLCAPDRARRLLNTYWTVSDRQIETSVVLELADPDRRRIDAAAA